MSDPLFRDVAEWCRQHGVTLTIRPEAGRYMVTMRPKAIGRAPLAKQDTDIVRAFEALRPHFERKAS